MKYVILILSLVIFKTCNESLEKRVLGSWQIKSLQLNNRDYTQNLLLNVIRFEKEGYCDLPKIIIDGVIANIDDNGKWKIDTKEQKLTIASEILLFNGEYDISFQKNNYKKLLGMTLNNDSVQIKLIKLLQNFEKHKHYW